MAKEQVEDRFALGPPGLPIAAGHCQLIKIRQKRPSFRCRPVIFRISVHLVSKIHYQHTFGKRSLARDHMRGEACRAGRILEGGPKNRTDLKGFC